MENSTDRCAGCGFYEATLLLSSDLLRNEPGPKFLCERCAAERGDTDRCEFRRFTPQNSTFARLDAGYLLGAFALLRPAERTIYDLAILVGDGNRRPVSQRQLAAIAGVARSTVQLALTRLAWVGLVCLLPQSRGTRVLIVRERGTSSEFGLRGSVVKPGVYAGAEKLARLYAVLELAHWAGAPPARRSTAQTSGPVHRSTSPEASGPVHRSKVDRPSRSTHPYGDLEGISDPSLHGPDRNLTGPVERSGTEGRTADSDSWKWGKWKSHHPTGSWFQWVQSEPEAFNAVTGHVIRTFRDERTETGVRGPLYGSSEILDGLRSLSALMGQLGHDREPADVLRYLKAQAAELVRDGNGVSNPLLCACKRQQRIREWFEANGAKRRATG